MMTEYLLRRVVRRDASDCSCGSPRSGKFLFAFAFGKRPSQKEIFTPCSPHRRSIFLIASLGFLLFFIIPYISWAEPVSSTELIEHAKVYNNKVVEYQGEVVGDVMRRGDFAWVNLNDGKSAIGIWGRYDLFNSVIKYKGGYNYKGDTLKVIGVFHRACPEHGGDLDIHLNEIIKIKSGFLTPHTINFAKVINAIGLFIVALGLSILCAIKTRRK